MLFAPHARRELLTSKDSKPMVNAKERSLLYTMVAVARFDPLHVIPAHGVVSGWANITAIVAQPVAAMEMNCDLPWGKPLSKKV